MGVPLCLPARVSPGGWGSRLPAGDIASERGDETLGVQQDSVSRGGQDEAHAAASEAATSRAASDPSWTWLIYADSAAPAPLFTCPPAPQTTQPHRRLATPRTPTTPWPLHQPTTLTKRKGETHGRDARRPTEGRKGREGSYPFASATGRGAWRPLACARWRGPANRRSRACASLRAEKRILPLGFAKGAKHADTREGEDLGRREGGRNTRTGRAMAYGRE